MPCSNLSVFSGNEELLGLQPAVSRLTRILWFWTPFRLFDTSLDHDFSAKSACWLAASLCKLSSSWKDDHNSHQFFEHLGPEISNIKSRSQSALMRKIKLEIKILLHCLLDFTLIWILPSPEQLLLCPDVMAGIQITATSSTVTLHLPVPHTYWGLNKLQ